MAFCKNCGKEVSSEAVVCVGCGVALTNTPVNAVTEKWSTGKCVGMGILSFIIPIIGFILGIMAVCKEPNRVMGIIMIVLAFVSIPFWQGFMSAM